MRIYELPCISWRWIDSLVVMVLERPGHSDGGSPMNRIKRIAAATAVSTVVLAPITAGLAFAKPDPGQAPQTSSLSTTKAQIEHEERLQMLDQPSDAVDGQSASSTGADTAGFPWEAVGLSALAGAAIAGGGMVVVRRFNHEPSRA
jgi:hypothetical protein